MRRWPRPKLVLLWLGVTLAALLGQAFSPGAYLRDAVEQPLRFELRARLGKAPALDSRLKILAFDDASVHALRRTEMLAPDWSRLVRRLARAKPAAILIDKVFGLSFEADAALAELAQANLAAGNVIAGSFASRAATAPTPLALEKPYNQIAKLAADPRDAAWLSISGGVPQGPLPVLRRSFDFIGHINDQGGGFVAPFLRVDHERVMPHIAFGAAKSIGLDADGPLIDGRRVPVDERGLLAADFPALATLQSRTQSLAKLVLPDAPEAGPIGIDKGDYVVIVPLYYSGNTDFRATPIGAVPGVFYHVAVMNSVLAGRWLVPARELALALLPLLAALGLWLGFALRPLFVPLVAVAAAGGIALASHAAFIFAGALVPWASPTAAFLGAAAFGVARRGREGELKATALRSALKGLISDERLQQFVEDPKALDENAAERVVTLMFIDVVGFSLLAEEHPPADVFAYIKAVFARTSQRIHEHGGTVDRTLGDGLLAYFGHGWGRELPADGAPRRGHADAAVDCAVAIQRDNVLEMARAAGEGARLATPLRIGINTASVFVGNVGSDGRLDFTVIGTGVNLAKRLETACDLHAVMLSETTLDACAKFAIDTPGMARRLIQVKHHEKPLQAVEFDPLAGTAEKAAATRVHAERMGLTRLEQRWLVVDPAFVAIGTEYGPCVLVDFSERGIGVELPAYLAKGVGLKLTLTIAGEPQPLTVDAEVRWGRPARGGAGRFAHGLALKGLRADQHEELVRTLRRSR